jgi:Ca2+-binding RTX toxin-like protein
MATFVASQALDLRSLFSATAGEAELDFTAGATLLTIVRTNSVFNAYGSGFTYDVDGRWTAGTVTGMDESRGGSLAWEIDGASYDAATIESFFDPITDVIDEEGLLGYLFAGDDSITGSNGNDTLDGFGGNDTVLGGNGNDSVGGGDGDDSLDGGAGTDRADYRQASDAVSVSLAIAGPQNTLGAGVDTLVNFEGLLGSEFDDTLVGASGNAIFETFFGMAGNDSIDGGVVTDTINYGDGNQIEYWLDAQTGVNVNLELGIAQDGQGGEDTLANFSFVIGTEFDDTMIGSNGSLFEAFTGLDGNDSFDGGNLAASAARIAYNNSPEAVDVDLAAGTADDGWGSTDTFVNINFVNGSAFNDTIRGSDTTAVGETFEARQGNDYIDGRGGNDAARYQNATGAVSVNLFTGRATGADGNDTLVGIETVRGSNFDDSLTGDALANRLEGRTGNDTLVGGDGNDTILGEGGNDLMQGGDGEDFFVGSSGNDTYEGGSQPANLPDAGGNVGRQFFDIVDYSASTTGFAVDLATGIAQATGSAFADSLSGIEGIRGGSGGDTLTGDANDNLFRGNGGDDSMTGGAGFDVLDFSNASAGVNANLATGLSSGGAGNDTFGGFEGLIGGSGNDTLTGGNTNDALRGGGGNDQLDGGDGIDRADYRVASGGVNVNLEAGTSSGADGADTLVNLENVRGSDLYNDTITGNGGANALEGRGGADTLVGGGGNDTLDGGTITDRNNYNDVNTVSYAASTAGVVVDLAAGTAQDGLGGTDTLIDINWVRGGSGNDSLTGSSANALFEFFTGNAGNDTINGGAITDTLNWRDGNRTDYGGATSDVNGNLSTGVVSGGVDVGTDQVSNVNQLVTGSGNDTLVGTGATAYLEMFRAGAGNDSINGGGGLDEVRYDIGAQGPITANLATGSADDGLGGTDTLAGIEGLRGGSGNDTLIGGNAASDALEFFLGGGGNDSIDGGSGYDRVDFQTSNAAVAVTLGGPGAGTAQDGLGGTDTLLNIEGVRGSTLGDTLTGSNVATLETFDGREGNDTINGISGLDRVIYNFSTAGVVVNLATGTASDGYGGTDTLSNIDEVLGSRDFGDRLTGNTGANRLDGQGGNDTLDGGAGNDTLIGGAGNDSYVVNASGDVISEASNGGTLDVVSSTATSYTLSAFVERLTLTGTAGIAGTGNAQANVITGNTGANSINGGDGADSLVGGSGNDTLNGGTGADKDTLVGGTGNDSYTVDLSSDVITETSSGGSLDVVFSTATSYTLSSFVERLTLNGTGNIAGTGNGQNNLITGNSGANTLNGGGGTDTLVGAGGNDTYLVDVGSDAITETSSGGTADTVLSTATSYTLGAFVERLTLQGPSNLSGTGNTQANLITGNTGANLLNGAAGNDTLNGGSGNDTLVGGTGNDSLIGGTGLDVFLFNAVLNPSSNVDRLSGFSSADDTIRLENAIFTRLTATGTLASSAFVRGSTALDAGDRILYNSATGQIWYDSDGTGAAAKILFATVTAGTSISFTDFVIV